MDPANGGPRDTLRAVPVTAAEIIPGEQIHDYSLLFFTSDVMKGLKLISNPPDNLTV